MALPELYLIGAPKAGTTSIAGWLSTHPAIYWSIPKEPYFWAADYPRMRSHFGFNDRESYEALFSSDKALEAKFRGEGSTTYLYSQTAVPDIRDSVPPARFIVCLRNPADLLISYHRTQLIALNEDEPDFGKAWRRHLAGCLPDTDPLDTKLLDYSMVGRLGQALQRLLTTIPQDQVHVVVFDDLVANPSSVWRSVASFVGVDPSIVPPFAPANVSDKTFRSSTLRKMTHRPPGTIEPAIRRLRQWSRTTHMPGVAALKRQMWRVESRPQLTDADRRHINDFFRDDIKLLSELVLRDLTDWSV